MAAPPRAPHTLNPHQQEAFDALRLASGTHQYRAFLLEGVTGSGKTEVYLSAIEATLALGRGALLLVPEIALTPAVAGQFHHRFGERVAILHSAFHDSERAQEWRRIRDGHASVVDFTAARVHVLRRAQVALQAGQHATVVRLAEQLLARKPDFVPASRTMVHIGG